jgi:hypothetical protein
VIEESQRIGIVGDRRRLNPATVLVEKSTALFEDPVHVIPAESVKKHPAEDRELRVLTEDKLATVWSTFPF